MELESPPGGGRTSAAQQSFELPTRQSMTTELTRPRRSDGPAAREGLAVRVAATLARTVGALSRRLRVGAGSTFPGRMIERLDPGFVARRAGAFRGRCVVVSGTNGKTTTASMLRAILRSERLAFAANHSGA